MARAYKGPVCYVGHTHEAADGGVVLGGWHYTIVKAEDGSDMPGDPLYLDIDTGIYRLAVEGDMSWHDRHHQEFVVLPVESADPTSEQQEDMIKRLLEALKGGDQ